MSVGLLNEKAQLPVKYNKPNIYQAGRKRKTLLRETRGVIRLVEVLKRDSISKIEQECEGDRGGSLCQIYIFSSDIFWLQAYNSILKVQIAIFSPFGNVQFLFKQ